MSDRQRVREQLETLADVDVDQEVLASFLLEHSKLPGPRANLELGADVARLARERGAGSSFLAIFESWLTGTLPDHPAAEYLPFCAVQGLGGLYLGSSPADQQRIAALLRKSANSTNWRLREGVTLGLQFIGEEDSDAMMAILRDWLPDATSLELRPVIATIAHPPILSRRPDIANEGIDIAGEIFARIQTIDASSRKQESFKVLAKGMGFAVSVIVAAAPERGFAMMRRFATSGDADINRILKENVGKSRLTKRFSVGVAEVTKILDAA
jgi:hypothetical protein